MSTMRSRIFFIVFCFGFQNLVLANPESLLGVSYDVARNNGVPIVFTRGVDEKYQIIIQGVRYKLRLKDLKPLYAELGSSFLLAASGVHTLEVSPVFSKRGQNGLPLSDEAQTLLESNENMGKAGRNPNFYFQTTVQKMAELSGFNYTSLDEEQLAELALHLLVHYIVGNHDTQFSTDGQGNIGFTQEGHFITMDISQSFKSYSEEHVNYDKFAAFMNLFNFNLESLEASQRENFFKILNRGLSRIENLSEDELINMFGPYQRAVNSFQRFKGWIETNHIGIMRKTIEASRGHLNAKFTGFEKYSTDQNERSHLSLPRFSLITDTDVSSKELTANEMLWALYFEDNPRARGQRISTWAQENDMSPGDFMEHLMNQSNASFGSGLQCKSIL